MQTGYFCSSFKLFLILLEEDLVIPKFVTLIVCITDESQKHRIKHQLLRNWDCLLFVQRLDIKTQTCAGGFIFAEPKCDGKMCAMILFPTYMYKFLMDYQSVSDFAIDFSEYVEAKFDPSFIRKFESRLKSEDDMTGSVFLDDMLR